ncbi:MAG: hypothetical protein ACLPN5_20260 [Roseiarcus sp.]
MSRRLRQNIVRRFGEYHFTKKLSAGAGWRTIAFSSSIRQPPQVMMVARKSTRSSICRARSSCPAPLAITMHHAVIT